MAQVKSKKSTTASPAQYGKQPSTSLADQGLAPDAQTVQEFHTNADTDVRTESIHHTLGQGPNQASPGDHLHDGGSSPLLLAGTTISGSRGGNVALQSVISALVRLGAIDSTT